MSRENHDNLSTADLVAGAEQRRYDAERMDPRAFERQQMPPEDAMQHPDAARMQERAMDRSAATEQPMPTDQPAALFPREVAADFRGRWDAVQIGFVDDPRRAVQQADELVAQVMKSLAASFAEQRTRLESGLSQGEHENTEHLRMALRSYRSFFQRLLSL